MRNELCELQSFNILEECLEALLSPAPVVGRVWVEWIDAVRCGKHVPARYKNSRELGQDLVGPANVFEHLRAQHELVRVGWGL